MNVAVVFNSYPLKDKNLKYFINREKELDFSYRVLTSLNGEVIGVIGGRGSGKTSFLYAVENLYTKERGKGKILWITGKDLLTGNFNVHRDTEVIFIDDILPLTDDEAKTVYEKIYDIAQKYFVNIVYTDKVERDGKTLKSRVWATTRRYLIMDCDLEKGKEIFTGRLKKFGFGSMFEDDALDHLAIRSLPNLRDMFIYASEAYILTGKYMGITKEEVDRAIVSKDMSILRTLGEIPNTIMIILSEKVRKGNYPGISTTNLHQMVTERIGRKISYTTFYEALNELASMRMIVTYKQGKERYVNTIYNILSIELKIKGKERYLQLGI